MTDIDEVLIVGPTGGTTGGIRSYILGQAEHLSESVSTRVYDVGTPNGGGTRQFLHAVLLATWRLLRFPFHGRPDLVHVHTSHYRSFYQSAGYVFFAAFVWRVPVVLHIHGSSFDRFVDEAPFPVALLQRFVFDTCDAVIVLSSYWRDVLQQCVSPERLVVLPNAVRAAAYRPSSPAKPHVCFVSDHIDRKGLPEFVTAVRRLKRSGAAFRVTIAGKGPRSQLAADLAAEFPEVAYVGFISEGEKRELLSNSSLYVLPAHAEGLPIAILEAMAGGNAIISTTVGSIPSAVDDANGRLISPGDVDALTATLGELVSMPGEVARMGQESRTRVVERYDWPAVAATLVGLYDELGERRGEPPLVSQPEVTAEVSEVSRGK